MNKVAEFKKVSLIQWTQDIRCIKDSEHRGMNRHHSPKSLWYAIELPVRATKGSAGHDIKTPIGIVVKPQQQVIIPTGLRCEMSDDYVMFIAPRSSMGIKNHMFLSNTIGVIDSDYAHANNEGHIWLAVENHGTEDLVLPRGTAIAQAIFLPYGTADTEEILRKRNGGIGSTTEE